MLEKIMLKSWPKRIGTVINLFKVIWKINMDTLQKANTALVQENYKTAIALYTSTIQNSPLEFEAHLHKAIAHMNLGEYEEAEACAQRAMGIDASNHLGYLYRGRVRFMRENWKDAMEDFNYANQFSSGCSQEWIDRCKKNMVDAKANK